MYASALGHTSAIHYFKKRPLLQMKLITFLHISYAFHIKGHPKSLGFSGDIQDGPRESILNKDRDTLET